MTPRLSAILCPLCLLLAHLAAGCAARPVNPAFPITPADAKQALREMSARPQTLQRPVVIVGGYFDPNVSTTWLHRKVRQLTGDDRVIGVVIGFSGSFEQCREKLIEEVDHAFPGDDPRWTAEVDVIGASLGGLVARYAAAPSRQPDASRRLRIARLFSISSPHRGARLAELAAFTDMQREMRPLSPFIEYLEATDPSADYEAYSYVCLGDWIVGAQYAAPPGHELFWLAPRFFSNPLDGHKGSWHDPRIIADIARRIRGETPFSTAQHSATASHEPGNAAE